MAAWLTQESSSDGSASPPPLCPSCGLAPLAISGDAMYCNICHYQGEKLSQVEEHDVLGLGSRTMGGLFIRAKTTPKRKGASADDRVRRSFIFIALCCHLSHAKLARK